MPKRKTMEEVKNEFFNLTGNEYTILTKEYINKKQKLEILHSKCQKTFEMNIDGFIYNGNRCKYCSPYRSWVYSTDEFKKAISDSYEGNEYEVLDEYKNTHTHILIKHKTCRRTFEMRPNNFLIKGNRCPNCPRSLGEKKIREYLIKNNLEYISDVKVKGLGNLRFDFKVYYKDSFVLVEYDGRFHYESFSQKKEHINKYNEQIKNDNLKNEFCKQKRIQLIRIPYTELNNIEKILEKTFNDYPKREYTQVSGNADHL
jgi:hypothetical protein